MSEPQRPAGYIIPKNVADDLYRFLTLKPHVFAEVEPLVIGLREAQPIGHVVLDQRGPESPNSCEFNPPSVPPDADGLPVAGPVDGD